MVLVIYTHMCHIWRQKNMLITLNDSNNRGKLGVHLPYQFSFSTPPSFLILVLNNNKKCVKYILDLFTHNLCIFLSLYFLRSVCRTILLWKHMWWICESCTFLHNSLGFLISVYIRMYVCRQTAKNFFLEGQCIRYAWHMYLCLQTKHFFSSFLLN